MILIETVVTTPVTSPLVTNSNYFQRLESLTKPVNREWGNWTHFSETCLPYLTQPLYNMLWLEVTVIGSLPDYERTGRLNWIIWSRSQVVPVVSLIRLVTKDYFPVSSYSGGTHMFGHAVSGDGVQYAMCHNRISVYLKFCRMKSLVFKSANKTC